jgi:hypothetical protein
MKGIQNPNPPRIMLQAFRWYCHPNFREEIEGDLLEQFHLNVSEYGLNKAKLHFVLDVLLLCRPEIMGNFYQLTIYPFQHMYTSHWIKLIGLNLLFGILILLRFVPGPPNQVVTAFSVFGFFGAIVGIFLVPISFAWAIVEFQKLRQTYQSSNHWRSGYYFAIAAMVVCFAYFVLALALVITEDAYGLLPSVILLALALWKIIPQLKKLRQEPETKFNAIPFYLLSVPLVGFLVHMCLVVPVSQYSRNYVIKKTESLISAIENYKTQKGQYPESISALQPNYLREIPRPTIMGIMDYQYEKTEEAYNLSFQQQLGATDELVVYNKANTHNIKGHFASFDAKVPHWRYYWMD